MDDGDGWMATWRRPMTWHMVAWFQVLTEAIQADLQALTPGTTSVRGPASGHRESHQACAGVHHARWAFDARGLTDGAVPLQPSLGTGVA